MCSTCGCSDEANVSLIDLDHDHAPAHHPHRHDDHEHEHHEHQHQHEHPHQHRHDHAHEHAPDRLLRLEEDILAKNSRLAERNRGWFEGRGVVALNLMSSPGAGKTTLLERTVRELGPGIPIQVIEGDQATALDGERIRAAGGRVVQINTGSGCHLDADMLGRALHELDPPFASLLLVENVGNLVCPALFDLGEESKIVIMSVTEGEDKPLKYPNMFRGCELMLLNKVDLLPHLRFDVERSLRYARQVNPSLSILPLSAETGEGVDAWYGWLRQRLARRCPSIGKQG